MYTKISRYLVLAIDFFDECGVESMVATGQEIVREKKKFFKVREKSGNFTLSQGKFTSLKKVREK